MPDEGRRERRGAQSGRATSESRSRSTRRLVATLLASLLVLSAGCAGIAADDQPGTETSTATPSGTSPTSQSGSSTAAPTESMSGAGGQSGSGAESTERLDDDGLSAERERLVGTDPTNPDTDGDGLNDGKEVELGTDPLVADTDGDGLEDGRERELGTDPLLVDTDDDKLDDAAELDGRTDPLVADTDGDGVLDGQELEAGLNPVLADTDEDGLNDSAELQRGTDPLSVDTDADGVRDGREVTLGTDPLTVDTDGDGLDDHTEITGPTNATMNDTDEDELDDGRERELGTNATNPDTDGDSLLDGWEVRGETPGGADLPGADPLAMDLYVLVSHSEEAWRFRDSERTTIRAAFKNMNVENPDGTTGIDVHFARGPNIPIDRSFYRDYKAEQLLEQAYYTGSYSDFLGPRAGVYHHVILMRLNDERKKTADFDGYATTPGRRVLADEDELGTNGGTIVYRDRMIIRGLLQNILGEPDPQYKPPDPEDDISDRSTKSGWTRYEPDDPRAHEYLPRHFADQLEREGYATSPVRSR